MAKPKTLKQKASMVHAILHDEIFLVDGAVHEVERECRNCISIGIISYDEIVRILNLLIQQKKLKLISYLEQKDKKTVHLYFKFRGY